MKIDPTINPVSGVNGAGSAAETRSRTAGKNGADVASGAAAVHLSESAQQIQLNAGAGPATDPGRIAEIRQAIADGSFSIDSNAIADRIIMTARALIAPR